jgi:hypothetical protein
MSERSGHPTTSRTDLDTEISAEMVSNDCQFTTLKIAEQLNMKKERLEIVIDFNQRSGHEENLCQNCSRNISVVSRN